jgi:TfoX/Sxy family transcriptional regulator of competence genes
VAYDEVLAERVREVVGAEPGMTEKRMFGGLGFLLYGNLAVSASGQGGLLVRIDGNDTDSLTSDPHVRRFEMRGREMAGWLQVGAEALADDDELRRWVDKGITYARSLPAK